jgi:hypothetical protein
LRQKKEQLGNYFLLQGQLLHLDPYTQEERPANSTEVVVYQGDEIYVVFDYKKQESMSFISPSAMSIP